MLACDVPVQMTMVTTYLGFLLVSWLVPHSKTLTLLSRVILLVAIASFGLPFFDVAVCAAA